MTAQIIQGDARHLPLADTSVDLICTSPPYFGLRSYTDGGEHYEGQLGAEATPAEFVDALIACTREWMRVLKPSGSIWVNLGDKYGGSLANPGTTTGLSGIGKAYKTQRRGAHGTIPGTKSKSLIGVPWRYAIRCIDDLGLILRAEVIWSKCLSGGTQMYARVKGRPMSIVLKDLARYDPADIQLWTGEKWSQVLRIDPTPPTAGRSASSLAARQARYRGKPIPALTTDLEVELKSGERIGCTPNHKWPTRRGEVRADELLIGDVIPTSPLPDEPASFAGLDDEEVGWFVGMYLAEGSRSERTIQLSGHIREVDRNKRLAEIASAYHGTCKVFQTSTNGITANLTGRMLHAIIDTYLGGTNAKTKRLSPKCWQRSNRFLDALLRGYLEGDGHQRPGSDEWVLGFTNNDGLAADLRTLAARLGLSVHLRRYVHKIGDRGYPGWKGTIRPSEQRRQPDGMVVAIRQSRARQFWNIEIADEPHLYALASGVTTRNSNGLPESVTDRVRRSHETWFHFTKEPRYFSAVDEIREGYAPGTAARYAAGYNPNARVLSGSHNNATQRSIGAGDTGPSGENPLGKLPGSVWTIPTQPLQVPAWLGIDHFAAFPFEFPRRIIRGWSPAGVCGACGEGRRPVSERLKPVDLGPRIAERAGQRQGVGPSGNGLNVQPTTITGYACACPDTNAPTVPAVVLDPFGGTGTTALVAKALGRRGISVDMSADYCRLAEWRTNDRGQLADAMQVEKPDPIHPDQLDLFGDDAA